MNIDYSPEELQELEERTNVIVSNLKYIEENVSSDDLEELEARTNVIVSNLKEIDQH